MKRVVDLFAGGGGMSLGFTRAGFNVVCAVEKWQAAIDVYRANFPDHPVLNLDLSNVDDSIRVIQEFNPEMIIGGPPCQDFSSAGKRDEKQGRASLTVNFAEIVSYCRPQFFVMENVARAEKSQAFKDSLKIFKAAGYGLTMRVIDAAYCGVPQSRKRFIVIGALGENDDFLSEEIDQGLSQHAMSVRDYFGDDLSLEHYYRHPRSYARRGIFSVDEPSPTIRGVNRPVPKGYPGHSGDPVGLSSEIRSLNTLERAQIQTFPSHFKFPGNKTDTEQVIGNAVPVKLAEFVAEKLAKFINGAPTLMCQHALFQIPEVYEP